ncbi:hypothetical protein JCM3770_003891 [Rhodotorula araucariae]
MGWHHSSVSSSAAGSRSSGSVARSPAPAPASPPGLLPSFAHGRFLPPPHPALARESTDPRSYSSTTSWGSSRSLTPSNDSLGVRNGRGRGAVRPPSPAREAGVGAKPQLQARRVSSPYLDYTRCTQPPRSAPAQPPTRPRLPAARPPSPLHRPRSFHPSHASSTHTFNGSMRLPSIIVTDSRPSLRRTHSQVELDSPTIASIPPSPTAPAHFSAAERHRTIHSNEQGYRSLVRRASLSSFDLRVYDDDEVEAHAPAMGVPTLPQQHSNYTYTSIPVSHVPRVLPPPPHLPNFPPDDPRIPPTLARRLSPEESGAAGAPHKRTIFTPYELSILQALWNSGRYYPNPAEVEEVQRRTGLSRVQVRNWFANKRQRATGDEKTKVVMQGKDLAVAF